MMKKINSLLLIISLSFSFFIVPTQVNAKTILDLQKELDKKQSDYDETKKKQSTLNNNINLSKDQIGSNETSIKNAENEVIKTGEKIQNLDSDIEKKRNEIQSLMKLMQLTDADNGYLEYIFGAKDMTDFIHRITMIEELAKYNDTKIDELNQMIEQSKKLQIELRNKQQALAEQIDQLNNKIQKYNSELTNLSDVIVDVAGEIKTLRDSIAYYRSKGCKDTQDLEVCLRNNLPYDTAFWRPIIHGAVTSEYGGRIHPTYGTYKMHYGTDIFSKNLTTGAAENTEILASASGKVAVINNKNNNSCGGNYIIIHHNIKGVEYSTLYMHLKKIYVKLGDIVTKDTAIALMGGNPNGEPGYTPWDKCSTGKHLHFAMSRGLNLSISGTDKNSFNPRTLVNIPAGTYKFFTNRTTKY